MPDKIAIVVQRFGAEITGGAEAHARALAMRLANIGHQVEVFTTTAESYQTWANALPAGTTKLHGLTVHRFNVHRQRAPWFPLVNATAKTNLLRGYRWFEQLWLTAQGPVVPELVAEVVARRTEFASVIFFSYLYYPTVRGVAALVAADHRPKVILVHTAHPEAPLYFQCTRDLLNSADHVFANSDAEADLICSVAPTARVAVVGTGIDKANLSALPAKYVTLQEKPYILYLGRVSKGKGLPLLLAAFRNLQHPDVQLVLAGALEPDLAIPNTKNIVCLGHVDNTLRDQLIQHAAAVVNPSPLESLSLVALEAMLAGKRLLLNRSCAVFRRYGQFPSVRMFESATELAAAMKAVLAEREDTEIAAPAKQWVESKYSWPKVLAAYQTAFSAQTPISPVGATAQPPS